MYIVNRILHIIAYVFIYSTVDVDCIYITASYTHVNFSLFCAVLCCGAV